MKKPEIECKYCGKKITRKRVTQQFCSTQCRQHYWGNENLRVSRSLLRELQKHAPANLKTKVTRVLKGN